MKSHKNAMQKRLTKGELKKLRSALPNLAEAYEKIAEKTGLMASSVEQILYKPERFNMEVIEEAIVMAEKANNKIDELKNRIKNSI